MLYRWKSLTKVLSIGKAEIRYTQSGKYLYLILTHLPSGGSLTLANLPIHSGSDAVLLASGQPLQWRTSGDGIRLILPDGLDEDTIPVVRMEVNGG